jgi:hypothetical protein
MRGGREHGHANADLGDEFLGRALADAGDLVELVHGVGEWGDQLVDAGVEDGDVRGQGVMRRSMLAQRKAWWSSK